MMYDALKGQLGVITAAATLVGMDRRTHYKWMHADENYKAWVDELPDITLDFAENALFKLIKRGNVASVIFYLKTKGKVRGYIEKQEIDFKGNIATLKLTQEEREAEIKRLLGQ